MDFPVVPLSGLSPFDKLASVLCQHIFFNILSQASGPEVIKLFSCSTQKRRKFSLQQLAFSYSLAEKLSGSAMFSRKEFATMSTVDSRYLDFAYLE